jgi:hypothetical protein
MKAAESCRASLSGRGCSSCELLSVNSNCVSKAFVLDHCQWSGQVDALVSPIATRDTFEGTGDPARLPACSLLGDGGKGEEKCFALGRLEQPRQEKNLSEPSEPTKEGPLSYVLPESPFASVSNSQQGPPLSLVSLIAKYSNASLQKQRGENVCNKTKKF